MGDYKKISQVFCGIYVHTKIIDINFYRLTTNENSPRQATGYLGVKTKLVVRNEVVCNRHIALVF